MSRDPKSITWLLLVTILLVCISLSSEQCVSDCTARTGYFPDCSRCDYFTQCNDGLKFRMPCQPRTYFNPSVNVCTQSLPVNCDANGTYIGPGAQPLSSPPTVAQPPYVSSPPVAAPPPQPPYVPSPPVAAPPPQPPYVPSPPVAAPPPQPPYVPSPPAAAPAPPPPPASSYPQNSLTSLDSMFAQPVGSSIDDLFDGVSFGTPIVDWMDTQNGAGSNIDMSQLGSSFFAPSPPSTGPINSIDSILYGAAMSPSSNPSPPSNPPQTAYPSTPSNPAQTAYPSPPSNPSQTAYPSAPSNPAPPTATGILPYYPYCIDTCAEAPNAIYADCNICTKYIVCHNGNLGSFSCQSGYYYNYNTGSCELDNNFCMPKVPNAPPTPAKPPTADNAPLPHYPYCADSCTEAPNGIYADCNICTKYTICQNGNLGSYSCQSGYYFNYNTGLCELDNNICVPKVSNAQPTPAKPPTADNATLPHYPYCADSCTEAPNGIYADCNICTKYTICQNGNLGSFSCQSGYYYNYNTGLCELDNNICVPKVSNAQPTPAKAPTADNTILPHYKYCADSCTEAPNGIYADCNICTKYTICQNGHLESFSCQTGYYYNYNTGSCDLDNNICVKSNSVSAPSSTNTNAGNLYVKPSAPTTAQLSPSVSAFDVCTTSCKDNQGANLPDGQYAHCEYCNAIVYCVKGSPSLSACPKGTYYNRNLHVCDFDDQQCVTSAQPSQSNGAYAAPQVPQASTGVAIAPPASPSSGIYNDIPWAPYADTSNCVQSCLNSNGRPIRSGIYKHCTLCNAFIMCSNGYLTEHKCPDKTYFNPAISVCDHDLGQCNTDENAVAANAAATSLKVFSKCISTCRKLRGIEENGQYPICGFCNVYMVCTNGQSKTIYCPDGYQYDITTGQCLYDDQEECKPHESPKTDVAPTNPGYLPSSQSSPPVVVAPPNPGYPDQYRVYNSCLDSCKGTPNVKPGRYGNCQFCNVLWECGTNGEETLLFCPDDQYYNQASGQCEKDVKGTCATNSPEYPIFNQCITSCNGQANGRYGQCYFCNAYLECFEEKEHLEFCPEGEQYDLALGKCIKDDQHVCSRDASKIEAPSGLINDCMGPDGPLPDGFYGHSADCTVIVACYEGLMIFDFCSPGSVYNSSFGKCELRTANNCKQESENTGVRVITDNMDTLKVSPPEAAVYPSCVDTCAYPTSNGQNVPVPDGYFSYCSDEKAFIVCKFGLASIYSCPPTYVYRAEDGTCVSNPPSNPHGVPVNKIGKKAYNACVKTCFYEYQLVKEGLYGKCDTCNQFVHCQDHTEQTDTCPAGTFYNSATGSCDIDTSNKCYSQTSRYPTMEAFMNKPVTREEIAEHIEYILGGQVAMGQSQETDYLISLLTDMAMRLNKDDEYPVDIQPPQVNPTAPEYNPDYQARYLPAPPGYAPNTQNYLLPQPNYGPQQGYNEPQQGYNGPQQGYNEPQQGYNGPQQGYNGPQQSYNGPQQGYNEPQQGYNGPQQGYNGPQPG